MVTTNNNLKFDIHDFANFVVATLLVAPIISQSLVDLCLALLFFMLFYIWKSGLQKVVFPRIPFLYFMLGYFGMAFVGLLHQLGIGNIPWDQMGKFIWIFNLFILVCAFANFRLKWRVILVAAASLSVIPSAYSLVTYFLKFDYLSNVGIARIVGLVNSATYHAHAGGILLVILLGMAIQFRKSFSVPIRIFLAASLFFLALSVWLTYTRGIWIALFGSTFFILFTYRPKVSFAFIIFIAVSVITSFQLNEKFASRLTHSLDRTANADRIDLFKVNVEMFKEYPLLGIGYGQNRERNREYWDRAHWKKPDGFIISHAHNQYLNVLTTTGVLGFFLFSIFFFGLSLRPYFFLQRAGELMGKSFPVVRVWLWGSTFILLACLTDVTFEYAKIRVLILIVWAATIAYLRNPKVRDVN